MSALVLDGQLKSALAAIRSLGRAEIGVVAGATRDTAMGLHSRYVSSAFVYPDPKHDLAGFVSVLKTEAARIVADTGEKPVVFCFSDATHLAIARHHESLQDVLLMPLPSSESLEVAFDKRATYALAAQLDVPIITTYSKEEFDSVSYPVVVKPSHSVIWKGNETEGGTAEFVFSKIELENKVASWLQKTGEPPLVQECITGPEYGVEMVCDKGEVLATFAHRRLRGLSPTGGAAVVKETADSNEVAVMRQHSETLVKALSWTGPIMVEWKVDENTDQPYLMEINGRFWGSLPLPIAAGVDFPVVYYELAKGQPAKNLEGFSPAVIATRHFLGDVKWLSRVFFDRTLLRKTHYPNRLRAFADFCLETFRSESDVWAWRDPLPGVYEIIDILKR